MRSSTHLSRLSYLFIALPILLVSLAFVGCGGGDGADGADGVDGINGTNGIDGTNGADGNDGSDGSNGSDGPTGPAGPAGDNILDISDADVLEEMIADENILQVEITGITTSGQPVVEFSLSDSHGNAVAGMGASAVSFNLIKLLPESTLPGGEMILPKRWQSYINGTETPKGSGSSPDVLAVALQASRDSGGALVDNGNGTYEYTFTEDVTNVTVPVAVTWEPTLTHRVGVEIRIDGEINPDNDTYDFVPDGSPVTLTKDMAATGTCGKCHGRLSMHGEGRFTADYCVTCHNPFTRDQDYAELLDMSHMVHAIHSAGQRGASAYTVYGYGEKYGSPPDDFSEVTFPQSNQNCQTCHEVSGSQPDGDYWETAVTVEACGACHVDGLVDMGADGTTGLSTYEFKHPTVGSAVDGVQVGNGTCEGCHLSGAFTWEGRGIDPVNAHLQDEVLLAKIAKDQFLYDIEDVTDAGGGAVDPGDTLLVYFRILDPRTGDTVDPDTMTPYDIDKTTGDAPFTNGKNSNTMLIAWNASDYASEGSGNNVGQPERIDIDAEVGTSITNQGDDTYVFDSSVGGLFTVPAGATDLTIAIEGHPGTVIDGSDESVPVQNVVYHVGNARRAVVDMDSCNNCHEYLSMHGKNRNNEPQHCALCHNPNATDLGSAVAFGTPGRLGAGFDWTTPSPVDGRGEQGIALGYMVHGIHAANTTLYGYSASLHDYTEVTFPEPQLNNCTACHAAGTFYGAPIDALPVTVGSGADPVDPDDDEIISPTTAACYPCHDSAEEVLHMVVTGGGFVSDGDNTIAATPLESTQADYLAFPTESCGTCHGEGSLVDVAVAHDLE